MYKSWEGLGAGHNQLNQRRSFSDRSNQHGASCWAKQLTCFKVRLFFLSSTSYIIRLWVEWFAPVCMVRYYPHLSGFLESATCKQTSELKSALFDVLERSIYSTNVRLTFAEELAQSIRHPESFACLKIAFSDKTLTLNPDLSRHPEPSPEVSGSSQNKTNEQGSIPNDMGSAFWS